MGGKAGKRLIISGGGGGGGGGEGGGASSDHCVEIPVIIHQNMCQKKCSILSVLV